ncbi:unnamed protein product, partial [marine sediment metagenome]
MGKKKIERDPSLGKPLRIRLSNTDSMIQTKLNVSFNTSESPVKLQV